jgi:hypothetical protein
MRQALDGLFNHSCCLLAALPLLAQAEKKGPTGQENPSGGAFKELFAEWWIWAGLVAVVVLLGVLYKVRKNQEED